MLEGSTASSRWRREGPVALTHLEENHQIGQKKKKRKKKNEISAVSKPSFPLVAIENVKWHCIAVYCNFNHNEPF